MQEEISSCKSNYVNGSMLSSESNLRLVESLGDLVCTACVLIKTGMGKSYWQTEKCMIRSV